nr:sarcosine oxidase [Cryptococcus depauperatus CBS 7855]
MTTEKTNVVIVGAGIMGMSTALWMLESGKYSVTMLDKCDTLPAPDAATPCLTWQKVLRLSDYIDPLYSALALDARTFWRKPEWEGTYHESGIVALSTKEDGGGMKFITNAYDNCLNLGLNVKRLPDAAAIRSALDPSSSLPLGDFGGRQGYANAIGGWAEAGRALEVGLKRVKKLGGVIRAGAEAIALIKDGNDVKGVETKSGERFLGDLVVVAAGAWTPQFFAYSGVSARLPPIVATGQSIAMLQLTPEEVKKYANVPVVLNFDNGWYIFPPSPQGLLKMSIHGAGYINPINGVSVPRTKLTPGAEDGAIPKVMLTDLRESLAEVYPELAKKDYVDTRICWYCDSITGDWLIDYHPDYNNLFVISGDSGHAFKFAVIIGREILKIIERQPSDFAVLWSFDPPKEMVEPADEKGDVATELTEVTHTGADVRGGMRKLLVEHELVKPEDLKA